MLKHRWDVTPREAVRLQEALRGRIRIERLRRPPRLLAGVDATYLEDRDLAIAGVVVVDGRDLATVEEQVATVRNRFPYVPGLLTFREGPAVLAALARLHRRPDVILFDGQGIAHPRGMGLASHVGLWLDLPSIGCAKSRLVGTHDEPGPGRGSDAPLFFQGRQVGLVLRTRERVRPVYVSVGHRVDLTGARAIVLAACTRFRLPEPARRAHNLVTRARRELL